MSYLPRSPCFLRSCVSVLHRRTLYSPFQSLQFSSIDSPSSSSNDSTSMKTITHQNFLSSLVGLRQAISEADLVAIDTELSGLQDPSQTGLLAPHFYDTPQSRYSKIKSSCQKFSILQFGLSCFKYSHDEQKFIAKPFSFYLFKRPWGRLGKDGLLIAQCSSLEFLAKHMFDFNKMIYEGISYLRRPEEQELRDKLIRKETSLQSDIPIEESNREFVESVKTEITNWLQNSNEKQYQVTSATNAYFRRLVHQTVQKMYNGFLSTETQKGGVILVTRLTEEEKKQREMDSSATTERELQEQIGFRKVIDMLIEYKKPMIIHHGIFDLMMMYQQFIDDLPNSIVEFKDTVVDLFPMIIDTRYLALRHPDLVIHISSAKLEELFKSVDREPFTSPLIEIHPDYTPESEEAAFHDAAYDAYITGYSFLRMLSHVSPPDDSTKSPLSLLSDKEFISTYVHRLPLFGCEVDHLHFVSSKPSTTSNKADLTSPDAGQLSIAETFNRSNIWYIRNFPNSYSTRDIQNLVNSIAKSQLPSHLQNFEINTRVTWLNQTECIVTLREAAESYPVESVDKTFPSSEKLSDMDFSVQDLNRAAKDYITETRKESDDGGESGGKVEVWMWDEFKKRLESGSVVDSSLGQRDDYETNISSVGKRKLEAVNDKASTKKSKIM